MKHEWMQRMNVEWRNANVAIEVAGIQLIKLNSLHPIKWIQDWLMKPANFNPEGKLRKRQLKEDWSCSLN